MPLLTRPARDASGRDVRECAPAVLGRLPRGSVWVQLVLFGTFGVVFNVLYGALYLLLRLGLGPMWANGVALVLSTVSSTAANRRFTFEVRGPRHVVRHHSLGLTLLALGLGVTSGSLWLLEATTEHPTRLAELAVLGLANLAVGLVRFTSFRLWMRPHGGRS
jgi:putative flippase GtrA